MDYYSVHCVVKGRKWARFSGRDILNITEYSWPPRLATSSTIICALVEIVINFINLLGLCFGIMLFEGVYFR